MSDSRLVVCKLYNFLVASFFNNEGLDFSVQGLPDLHLIVIPLAMTYRFHLLLSRIKSFSTEEWITWISVIVCLICVL